MKRRIFSILTALALCLSLLPTAAWAEGTDSADDTSEGTDDTSTYMDADINVTKVTNLSDAFIMGMDISSVISEFNSGVIYYDFEGNKIDNVNAFCQFLKKCGVTTIRVRVWNAPYDDTGKGYGGGNNDINTAVQIANGCAAADLNMLVDFHCSDFWTDPSKQQAPKEWESYTVDGKVNALKAFVTDSLGKIANTGATISMVQIGNETTSRFIGETNVVNMCILFNAGAEAVRDFDPDIKVVIHVTNPEKSYMTTWAKNLSEYNVDYDILATSYYPSWHGTFANLQSQLQAVQSTYSKDVMVVETSYAFTLDDTDGHDNTIAEGSNDTMMCGTQYPFTVQGQASYLRDLIAAVSEAGGLGVFYWEPAWITVGDTTGLTGAAYDEQVEKNKNTWEDCGSGWASSYSAAYDPGDAGIWYGGSAVDNQALFAADGNPLASINVWNYVRTGAVNTSVSVDAIVSAEETIETGGTYALPTTIAVTYNNGTANEPVVWDTDDVNAIDSSTPGTYTVNGTVTFSKTVNSGSYADQTTASVTYTLTVKAPNLAGSDWSFENGTSNFSGLGTSGTDITTNDPYDGTHALHWYLTSAGTGIVTYKGASSAGIALEPGAYTFECVAQGSVGDTVTLSILNHDSSETLATGDSVSLTGWDIWATPTVSFILTDATTVDLQITIGIQAGGGGTVDCMYLYKTADVQTHTHTYGQPEWTWTETDDGGYTASAVFTCLDGDDTQTADATVTPQTTPATCTEDGETQYTATVIFDGQTYTDTKTVTINALGHNWGEWTVATAATCTEAGEETRTCAHDGATETRVIAAPGHDLVHVAAKAATYYADGNIEYWYCLTCGSYFSDEDGLNEITQASTVIPQLVYIPSTPSTPISRYPATALAADNGAITVSLSTASKGSTVTVTVTPDVGYELSSLTVTDASGKPVPVTKLNDTSYTFVMPGSGVTVSATFSEIEQEPVVPEPVLLPFTDVPESAYYYDAVAWAVKNGITVGITDITFSPNAPCTRVQAVTFLWRAAGSPAPKSSVNPFTDVKPGAYYYDAVLWAVENGIAVGTSATTFSPDATCTRAQIVTFLYRAEGAVATGSNPFTDVAASAYYADAVKWAAAEGVTAGTSETTFSPDASCTRAQIVTFLYRVYVD